MAHAANQVHDQLLITLSFGPSQKCTTWPGYFINGYNFHTVAHGKDKATMNSGVCVQGENSGETCTDFYGLLQDIVQLEYQGPVWYRIVLFDCKWFDPINGTRVHEKYKLVDVNRKRFYTKYDPFILAQQASQVYYVHYPSVRKDMVDWLAVCKTKAKRIFDTRLKEKDSTAFQNEDSQTIPPPMILEEAPPHLTNAPGINLFVDFTNFLTPISEADKEDEYYEDSTEEEEEGFGEYEDDKEDEESGEEEDDDEDEEEDL